MPLKSYHNHQLIWVDLLKDIKDASWYSLLSTLYSKKHGYSNYTKCKRRDHTLVRQEVFDDEKIKTYLEADESNRKKVEKILDEMCHLLPTQNNPTRKLKFAGFPFLKCITNVYSNIYALNHLFALNEDELGSNMFVEHYLKMSKDLPIVILPTHRSYMDFLLISYIMFNDELSLPCVAAGDNFKAMGKYLTDFLKGTGAFLVRRNANNKKDIEANNYYDILRAYVHSILRGGENPLEFFMEGTRTRSGQVLRPKTGLLSMVVDLYMDKGIEDVYILPVTINYQRPIEEQLYIAETTPQVDMKKPKESAKNLMTAFETIIKRKYGKVYIRFIQPFKLSEYFQEWTNLSGKKANRNGDKSAILQDFTNNLASKVCLAQAYHNVLMPFNLIAYSLISRSFLNKNYVQSDANSNFSDANLNYRIPVSVAMADFYTIENLLTVSQSQFVPGWKGHLDLIEEFQLDRDGIVRFSSDRKYIEFNSDAITFHTMQYYSNQVLQMCLPLSICLVLNDEKNRKGLGIFRKNNQVDSYKNIRKLLSSDFLMNELNLEEEYKVSMETITTYQISSESKLILVKHFTYFIQCYLTFLNYLVKNKVLDKSSFFQQITVSEQNSSSPKELYISKDMLKNMINLVSELEILSVIEADIIQQEPKPIGRKEERYEVINLDKMIHLREEYQQVLDMIKIVE